MVILRFLTPDEHVKLKELSQKEELQSDNHKKYYHAENMRDNEDVKLINKLLSETVEDFVSFSNFRQNNPDIIRLQYRWSEWFTGVGCVKIDELINGFEEVPTY